MKVTIDLRVLMDDVGFIRQAGRFLRLAGLVLALHFAVYHGAGAQTPQAVVGKARDDRSGIRVRYPEADKLRELQTDHDYQYGRDAPPPDNPVARFFAWLFRKIADFLSSEAYQNIWQYVVLAGIAGLVIYLLLKAEVLAFLFPKQAQSSGLAYENLAENIHEIDFDVAVDDAISQRNFRLAVRLLYLQTLKRLTDAGQIQYKPDKTNHQYVNELANSPEQVYFEQLTRQFEFVWYGNFPIDETRFQAIQHQFRQFGSRIQSTTVNHTP